MKLKEKLQQEVKLEKRNFFSIICYHAFSAIFGLLTLITSFFTFKAKNLETLNKQLGISKYVILGVIIAAFIGAIIAIRFYKNSNTIKIKYKHLFINKILTYIYILPLIGWITLKMMFKTAFDSKKPGSLGSFLITDFDKYLTKVNPYFVISVVLGLLLFLISLSLIIYCSILINKFDTKEKYEKEIEKKELEKINDEKLGTLQSIEVEGKEVSETNKEENK